jgi:heme/copper-type cytochrome/quinol oxidase subunit 2
MNQGQLIVRNSVKRKIVFAFLTGIVTTGMVSFTVVLINLGLTEMFWRIWLKSWSLAFLVVVPVILIVSPVIGRFVDFLFRESAARQKGEN